ncbi:MAG: hypothetical protein JWN48_4624 [Myxococcaceae bacterium]|nr:hypothetical protein [Myxococcaceae bacterium]
MSRVASNPNGQARRGQVRAGALAAAWLLALVLLPHSARAGNDDGILLGNEAALAGGAVVSTVDDGSALWYNPAGLALSGKDSVDVGASAFALRRYNMPGLLSADNGRGGNASFTEIVSIPSALTYVRRFNPNLVGGLGLFASQVGNFTLRSSLGLPLEQADGEINLLLTQQNARYHLAAGLATRLPHGLTLGMALFGDYYFQSGLVQAASQFNVGDVPVASQVSSALEQDKLLGLHVRFGATYELLPGLRLGASVQTGGGYIYRSSRITGLESTTSPNANGGLDLSASNFDQNVSKLSLGRYAPWRGRLGGSVVVGRAVLSLEGDVQSKLKDLDVQVDRRFVWNVRAGARLAVGRSFHLGAGLFTDRGSERNDPYGANNIDFYGCTVGGQYDSIHWLARERPADQGGTRSGLTFSSTVALRYAYGYGKLAGQRLSAPDFAAVERAVDIGVHEITLHLGSGVYF